MTLRLRPQISTVDTEYGAVLLDEKSGRYWQLNPTGATIVSTLLAGGTVDETARRLTEEFDVDGEQAGRDVRRLVADLTAAGLVVA